MPSSKTLRTPPHSEEAERGVLSSILVDEKSIDRIIHLLNGDDFYFPANRVVWNSIVALVNDNKPVDIVTLASRLKETEMLQKAGGIEYISALVGIMPNAANIVYYANIVKDKALLRNLIKETGNIAEKCFTHVGEVSELLDEAEKNVFRIAEYKLKSEVQSIGIIVKDTFEMLEALYKKRDSITGVPTGYIDLDKMTNGFQKSDLIVIAGRPGMGKTAFALNIALNAASKYDKSIAVFSLEMSSGQLVQRLLASEARVESSKLRSGRLNMDEWTKLAEVAGRLNDYKIYIDDTPAISSLEIRAKCRRLKREGKLDLIIVDYLQLMSSAKGDNREQQISEMSRSLKALAKELNVPVIALSQLNRSVEGRNDKRPVPSDLRESGAIEQDADIIIFLYRDDFYNKESKYPGIAEVIIAKHRNGPTGTVPLSFIKEFTKFENCESNYRLV